MLVFGQTTGDSRVSRRGPYRPGPQGSSWGWTMGTVLGGLGSEKLMVVYLSLP